MYPIIYNLYKASVQHVNSFNYMSYIKIGIIIIFIYLFFKCVFRIKYPTIANYKDIIANYSSIKNHQLSDYQASLQKIKGDEGEQQLKAFIMSNKNFEKATIYSSKRIFDSFINHKREIDVIVVSKKSIYVIECKNWSGQIVSFKEKSDNLNYKHNSMAFVEARPNPLKENSYKLNILKELIKNNVGDIPDKFFVNKVVFINKHMLYPPALEKAPNAVTYNQLAGYFSLQKTGQGFSLPKTLVSGLLKLLLSQETAQLAIEAKYGDLPGFDRVLEYLDSLPTWDYLTLLKADGSKVTLAGDVRFYKNVFFGPQHYRDMQNITVKYKESLIIPLLFKYSALFAQIKWSEGAKGARPGKLPLNAQGFIEFQIAGDPDCKTYSILDVDSIIIGRK
ncbi:MAG: NERD domain-containing protein [Deltaproteobacteria bacterium]|jgi:hypothetical protein|nr:NERD domain-containing protein [Deltaproteobacteria bacterium]